MTQIGGETSLADWRLPLSSGGDRTPRDRQAAVSEPRLDAPEPRFRPEILDEARDEARVRVDADPGLRPRRRRQWLSPITRRILLLNILALIIPVIGLLYLPTYRDSLVAAELDLLQSEATLFAGALSAGGIVTTAGGVERLDAETVRQTLRRLVLASHTRARLFAPTGALIADSQRLPGFLGEIEVYPLPPIGPGANPIKLWAAHVYDWLFEHLPSYRSLPAYTESVLPNAGDYWEVPKALAGDSARFVRDGGNGIMILSAAVPVQRYRQVLGALFLTRPATGVEETLRETRLAILGVFALALSVTILISLYLASTIALPIHRLADAAERVRRAKGKPGIIPDLSRRNDEIGDLSLALQEMTEAVWQRMGAIERFAADVAHELKNPLTSLRSAVETIARIEDPEQQKRLMSIIKDDVQRLDRLISDIADASRLDAELSRAEIRPVDLRALILALIDIHGATAGENAPRLLANLPGDVSLVTLGLEGRLGQVFRNLIGNAVSFSPPKGAIWLLAERRGDTLRILVEDEGPGIPPDKLQAIFDRFYSERPRGEKFGTHSGLGLSISKQIVEAHGGRIAAENRLDAMGRILGARFIVLLPAA